MIKLTETYTDFSDTERTEDFYFNLTKAELLEMEMTTEGGLAETIMQIVNAKKTKELITLFKDLILKAYGEKSPDGRRFIKSKELSEEFAQTEAYSNIFMRLATDDKAAAEFINGIIPAEMAKEVAALPEK